MGGARSHVGHSSSEGEITQGSQSGGMHCGAPAKRDVRLGPPWGKPTFSGGPSGWPVVLRRGAAGDRDADEEPFGEWGGLDGSLPRAAVPAEAGSREILGGIEGWQRREVPFPWRQRHLLAANRQHPRLAPPAVFPKLGLKPACSGCFWHLLHGVSVKRLLIFFFYPFFLSGIQSSEGKRPFLFRFSITMLVVEPVRWNSFLGHFWTRPVLCLGGTGSNTWHGISWSSPWIQKLSTRCSRMGLMTQTSKKLGTLETLLIFTNLSAGKGSDPSEKFCSRFLP